jgi:hypothetical protein
VQFCYQVKGATEETCVSETVLATAILIECCFYFVAFFGGWAVLKSWLLRKRRKPIPKIEWQPPNS